MTRIVLDIDDTMWKVDHLARVMRRAESEFLSELAEQVEIQVHDARPLIVLMVPGGGSPRDNHWPRLAAYLRQGGWDFTADQIEAQTKPARIPEPGWDGKVLATTETNNSPREFVRFGGRKSDGLANWYDRNSFGSTRWADIIDPTLIREGLS